MNFKLLVCDVDGTLTDSGIYYDENGNEFKKFCTKDAAGFFAAKNIGIKTMILTGRNCEATTRRMKELKVDYLYQNINNKADFMKEFMLTHKLFKENIIYIGDDLNDLPSMALCGYIGCPADSCSEIKEIANYVSTIKGGYGAVRDIIEHILKESGQWNHAISNV
ncbi:MAG: HAD-IIIA family hydrolase, partial [Eubacterium coprostanoligenes]|uniref:KdsC family phosphatase n=1 Tax=Eubacterium coprostanoligenes TaxID=290054 RepID=UPI0023544AA4